MYRDMLKLLAEFLLAGGAPEESAALLEFLSVHRYAFADDLHDQALEGLALRVLQIGRPKG